ncbi:MAG: IS256 family transposase, partial [Candidatus Saccharicenans sp.]|nr:IS256 family transposase [Candidatus Saccharicenans sp.]
HFLSSMLPPPMLSINSNSRRCLHSQGVSIKYLIIDGVHFKMRVTDSVKKVPVLVAIGVKEEGQRLVLGFQAGDRESASNWREFFKDLKHRGLQAELIQLGVMDDIPELEEVFKEEFPRAEVQRCIVYLSRNVLAKVPRKLKGQIGSELRAIFYAPSEKEARERFLELKSRWQNELPSAVACLERALQSALTFFKFPAEEWLGLRTTNIIERLNKEFKRRPKVREILASEKALYNLLAFICLKMELHWRKSPMGRVLSAMFKPQLEAATNFTQNA